MFINSKNRDLHHVKIDGCYILDQTKKKCDFLLLDKQKKSAYFIELKGKDVKSAIEQIDSTIEEMKKEVKEFERYCRIILSRYSVPNLRNTPRYLRLVKKIGGPERIIIKTGSHEEKI